MEQFFFERIKTVVGREKIAPVDSQKNFFFVTCTYGGKKNKELDSSAEDDYDFEGFRSLRALGIYGMDH